MPIRVWTWSFPSTTQRGRWTGFWRRSSRERVAQNVIAVDAGSLDESAAVAERHRVRVVRLPERAGPARARNEGARHSSADVLLFIDSDCVAHADCIDRVRAAFRGDPGLASLTGSYDVAPSDPGFFSQYVNLRHHFVHQRARREDATFWAGCGAVRRTALPACRRVRRRPLSAPVDRGHGAGCAASGSSVRRSWTRISRSLT